MCDLRIQLKNNVNETKKRGTQAIEASLKSTIGTNQIEKSIATIEHLLLISLVVTFDYSCDDPLLYSNDIWRPCKMIPLQTVFYIDWEMHGIFTSLLIGISICLIFPTENLESYVHGNPI